MEAWYAGNSGSAAIANVLFGKADAAGRLPITFPAGEDQLPRPQIPGAGIVSDPFQPSRPPEAVAVDYREGADIGLSLVRQAERAAAVSVRLRPLLHELRVSAVFPLPAAPALTAHVTVANTGKRTGWETAQFYVTPPAPGAVARLVGWRKVQLKPGEKRDVVVTADLRTIAHFDDAADVWRIAPGSYRVAAGGSSADLPLATTVTLDAATLKP